MARGCRPTEHREQVALCLQIYGDNGGLVKQWVNKPRNWWPTTLPFWEVAESPGDQLNELLSYTSLVAESERLTIHFSVCVRFTVHSGTCQECAGVKTNNSLQNGQLGRSHQAYKYIYQYLLSSLQTVKSDFYPCFCLNKYVLFLF